MNTRTKHILSYVIIFLFLIGISLSSYLYFSGFDFEKYFQNIHLNMYEKIIIVLGIYIIRNYLLIPSTIIILFTGFFLQNFLLTCLVSIIGVSIGIFQAYFVGYLFGEQLKGKKSFSLILKYNDKIQKDGFKVIFLGAFFPIIPVDILYYSAGIIQYNIFLSYGAGILGEMPLIILYAYLGEQAVKYSDYLGFIALFGILLYVIYSIIKNKQKIACFFSSIIKK